VFKDKKVVKRVREVRLRKRIRDKISGTAGRPRVHVFKSNLYLYTQVINDLDGTVLATASTLEKSFKEKTKDTKNVEAAGLLGEILGKRLKEKKIERVVFDRGIYPYHGQIKALAEAMRKEGILF
jgi:large subunit ribosomal protein L18